MALSIIADSSYPNRLQLLLGNTFQGPLTSSSLGAFDPSRDLFIFVDGVLSPVQTFNYDAPSNSYLMYFSSVLDLQGIIQCMYHLPLSPFIDTLGNLLVGFALVANFISTGSPLPPAIDQDWLDYIISLEAVFDAFGVNGPYALNLLDNLVNVELPFAFATGMMYNLYGFPQLSLPNQPGPAAIQETLGTLVNTILPQNITLES